MDENVREKILFYVQEHIYREQLYYIDTVRR
jgi:hypothetical protein